MNEERPRKKKHKWQKGIEKVMSQNKGMPCACRHACGTVSHLVLCLVRGREKCVVGCWGWGGVGVWWGGGRAGKVRWWE